MKIKKLHVSPSQVVPFDKKKICAKYFCIWIIFRGGPMMSKSCKADNTVRFALNCYYHCNQLTTFKVLIFSEY